MTLQLQALGAKSFQLNNSLDIGPGNVVDNNTYLAAYNAAGAKFLLLNPTPIILDWNPSITDTGAGSFGTVTTNYAKYVQYGDQVNFNFYLSGTITGVVTDILVTVPVTNQDWGFCFNCRYSDSAYTNNLASCYINASNQIVVKPLRDYTFGEGALSIIASGTYSV
jgi:hypothetical protein